MPNDITQYQSAFAHASAFRPTASTIRTAEQPRGGFLRNAADFAVDVLGSPVRAAEGVFDDVWGLADTIAGGYLPEFFERGALSRATVGDNRTIAGGMLDSVLEFLIPFTGAAKVLGKAGKLGKLDMTMEAGKLGTIARGAVAGAFADGVAFGGTEERLSNLIQEVPALRNPISEYLAADEDDGEIEGRFKNVLEGLGIGALTEPLIAVLSGLRKAKGVGSQEAAQKAVADAVGLSENPELLAKIEEAQVPDDYGALKERRDVMTDAGVVADRVQRSDGAKQVVARVREFADLTGDLSQSGANVAAFVDRVGSFVFDDIRVEFSMKRGEKSSFDFTNKLATIAVDGVKNSRLDREFIHEIYHALTGYIDPRMKARISEEFTKARNAAMEADPDLARRLASKDYRPSDYRWKNEDEWFVEVATARELDDLTREAMTDNEQVQSFLKKGRVLMQDVFDLFRRANGDDVVQDALKDLRKNKTPIGGSFLPINQDAAVAYSRSADNSVGGLKISSEDVAARQAEISESIGKYDEFVINRNEQKTTGRTLPDGSEEEVLFNTSKIDPELAPGLDMLYRDAVMYNKTVAKAKAGGAEIPVREAQFLEAKGEKLAQMLDLSGSDVVKMQTNLIKRLGIEAENLADGRVVLAAAADTMFTGFRNLREKVLKLNPDMMSDKELVDLAMDYERLSDLAAAVKGVKRESGRLLQSQRYGAQEFDPTQTPIGQQQAIEPDFGRTSAGRQAKQAREAQGDVEDSGLLDSEGLIPQEETRALSTLVDAERKNDELRRLVDEMGGAQSLKRMVKMLRSLAANTDEDQFVRMARMNRILEQHQKTGFFGAALDYYYFALLSSPATASVNAISGALMTGYLPMERMLGSAVMGTLSAGVRVAGAVTKNADTAARGQRLAANSKAGFMHAVDQIHGMNRAFLESWGAFKHTMTTGRQRLNPSASVDDAQVLKDLAGELKEGGSRGIPAGMTMAQNAMKRILKLPGNTLLATDEFWKNIGYRSSVYADAAGIARGRVNAAGEKLSGKEIVDYADSYVKRTLSGGHATTVKGIQQDVIAKIRERNPESVVLQDEKLLKGVLQRAVEKTFRERPEIGPVVQRALNYAEMGTWTHNLRSDAPGLEGLAAKMQQATIDHPGLRLIFPFVRTPANLLFSGLDRTMVGAPIKQLRRGAAMMVEIIPSFEKVIKNRRMPEAVKRQFQEGTTIREIQDGMIRNLTSNNPALVAQEVGKFSAALLMGSSLIGLAASGHLTGGGPADPDRRKTLLRAGWQPYSIRFGDTYISYARFDPFATMLGVAADVYEFGKYDDDPESGTWDTAAHGMIAAIARQMQDKTYLQGFSTVVDVLNDPEQGGGKLAQTLAATFVVPGAVKSVRDLTAPIYDEDPAFREVRDVLDKIYDRTPGLSQTLPPRRNILGEPIKRYESRIEGFFKGFLPIDYSTVTDDTIFEEMALLGHGFRPPRPMRNGIDLHEVPSGNTTAYDRWMELAGKVRVDGQNLREALTALINDPAYREMTPISTFDVESPRRDALNRVIRYYQRVAWRQTLQETPDLAQAVRDVQNRRTLARSGVPVL